VLVLCGVTGVLASLQEPVDSGAYEFGVAREFVGILREAPLPNLLMDDTGEPASAGKPRAVLIAGSGKFGLPDFAREGLGKRVRFTGSLIYRQNMTMVEMNDADSFEVLEQVISEPNSNVSSFGAVTLVGELVDTKCFFGVMKPGVGKVHRACAVVCLEGGIPPGLLLRQEDGRSTVVMLAGTDNSPLDIDSQWAARQLNVTGELEMRDGIPVLRTDKVSLMK
jgi:hypothetical protein